MSLKKFHIFFISVSSLLSLILIFWGVYSFKISGQISNLGYSLLGAVGVALLIAYLKWFLVKYKNIEKLSAAIAFFILSMDPISAVACSTCYQDPDSPLTQATINGVWFLVAVIVAVLISIILIARSWIKRAKALDISL